MLLENFTIVFLTAIAKTALSATFENVVISLNSLESKPARPFLVAIISDNHLNKYVHNSISGQVVDEVRIENQTVPKLAVNSVTDLTLVKNLHITRCKVKEIQPGAFRNLPKLKELSLSDNLLEEIKNGVFNNLPFETLYLENNLITRIETRAFNNLQMGYLFIDNNHLSSWDGVWFYGTSLAGLSASYNSLEKLPRCCFCHIKSQSLDYAVFNDNKISEIDPNAFEGLSHISYLNLQNNLLKHLEPGLFDSVDKIQSLDVSNNNIAEIYLEAFRKTELKELKVRNNRLKCISTDVFDVTDMDKVCVNANPITCDCLNTWEKWNGERSDKLEIENFSGLEEKCVGKTNINKVAVDLFVFAILFVLFL